MKKLSVLLFSALLISSVCFAEQASVVAPNTQEKVVENKKKDSDKKTVKPSVKKSGKKVKKATEPTKKVTEPTQKVAEPIKK